MADSYNRVIATILAQLATADSATWVCPWHWARGGLPRNALTGRTYRGINTLALWCGAQAQGYADARWATYRQWAELGAQVRRGEQGTPVLFYRDLPPETAHATRDDDAKAPRFVARASTVFNAAQADGAPALPALPTMPIVPTPTFDRFVANTGAVVRTGSAACYVPSRDEIHMPDRAVFRSAEGYCGTLAHELVHWTGVSHRLDRQLTTRFGSRAYAAEELVAELGAAFILAGLHLASEPHPNHAAYMAGWLPLLRDDPRALVTATSLASKAAQFLEAFSQPATDVGVAA